MRFCCALLFLLLVTGCSSYDPAGSWVGKTNVKETAPDEDRDTISLKVKDGAVTQLSVWWRLPLPSKCDLRLQYLGGGNNFYFHPGSQGNEPLKINRNRWKATLDADERVRLVIVGKFQSDDKATGDMEVIYEECRARARYHWKAEKQP